MHFICLLVLFATVFRNDAIELKENCQWNYTLKNQDLTDAYHVEMRDLDNDCKGLYEDIPSYGMHSGRGLLTVILVNTINPRVRNIKISWNHRSELHEYLLDLNLKLPSTTYSTREEGKRCIYVRVKPAQTDLQIQGAYTLFFDCIEIPVGTIKAVLETTLRVANPYIPSCIRETGINAQKECFKGPVYLASNINFDCCPKKLARRSIKILPSVRDSCIWTLSVKTVGFSAWDYVLRGSNKSQVEKGAMLPTRQNNVSARSLSVDYPDVYEITVSFWCSFDPAEHNPDHYCFNVTKLMNASLCNRLTTTTNYDVPNITEMYSRSKQPMIITSITLGCVILMIIIIAFVLIFFKRGVKHCCRRTENQPRNNLNCNGTFSGLLAGDNLQQPEPEVTETKEKEDDSKLMIKESE